ncbi:hypothetical protein [Streptacidiphilus jiangxiensis]|uniref:Uncharacterized protein n=1 Tax=Streptacidiphilus jiangxiensis TaxID=235985 RepID=A0A1H7I4A0_STRJI|nr:hypothetical protein [Streptacidiphilus jiangxiensis]SEK57184.1 hypothetical protein SAMN05414137_102490 [Streptacidiphilus jiangxiensis]
MRIARFATAATAAVGLALTAAGAAHADTRAHGSVPPGASFSWGWSYLPQHNDLKAGQKFPVNVGGVTESYTGTIVVCLDATQNLQNLHAWHLLCTAPNHTKAKAAGYGILPKAGTWLLTPEMYRLVLDGRHPARLVPLYGDAAGTAELVHVDR